MKQQYYRGEYAMTLDCKIVDWEEFSEFEQMKQAVVNSGSVRVGETQRAIGRMMM